MAAAGLADMAVESTPTIRDYPDKTVKDRPPAVAAVGPVLLVETAVTSADQAARALAEPLDLERAPMGQPAVTLPILPSAAVAVAAAAATDTQAPFFPEAPSSVEMEAGEETRREPELQTKAVMAAAAGLAATAPS